MYCATSSGRAATEGAGLVLKPRLRDECDGSDFIRSNDLVLIE
jgi:hypothetical protein